MNNRNIQRVTIMGLGLFGGGTGAARYWAEQGKDVIVTDLRKAEQLAPSLTELQQYSSIEYVLGEHRPADFTKTDLLVVNPAVKPDNPFLKLTIEAGIPITTEIGIFIREHREQSGGSILAVSGSNGKSTTTALLASLLSQFNPETLTGGNIGGSLLSALGTYPAGTPAVLELSSFQLHYLAREDFRPDIALLTNLAPNHLDWHITTDNYYADKLNLLSNQNAGDCAVLNYQDSVLKSWREHTKACSILTSLTETDQEPCAFVRDNRFIIRYDGTEAVLTDVSNLKIPGEHNISNALQALTTAYIYLKKNGMEAPEEILAKGLSSFKGLPHRQEIVAETDTVQFINDSIATTPESTIAALNSYPGRSITLIAGGYDKKISLEHMSREIAGKAKKAVLIGQTAEILARQIRSHNPDFPLLVLTDASFETAVAAAYEQTPSGIVLLSPGCASYGMFINFKERGDKFRDIAKKLSTPAE